MCRAEGDHSLILYKYLRPRRLDVLHRQFIRFTPPRILNDPFEMKPYYVGEETWEHLREWLIGRASELSGSESESYRQDLRRADHARLQAELDTYVNRTFGIFCLSEKRDDLLMWSHYADGHRGFVLGFDCTHRFFNWLGLSPSEIWRVAKVSYENNRPRVTLSTLKDARLLYMTKSTTWAYEQEWRFMSLLENADLKKSDGDEHPVDLFRYPAECLREVVFGCRAAPELVVELSQALRSNAALAHVACYQARERADTFAVHVNRHDI